MSTFEQFKESLAMGVHLLELRPGLPLRGWTATGGAVNVWELPLENHWGPGNLYRAVVAVREAGTLLTERASAADVEANSKSWYWDEVNGIIYCQGSGGNPDIEDLEIVAELKLHFATQGKVFNNIVYEPRMKPDNIPAMKISGLNFLAESAISTESGEIVLDNSDGQFDEFYYDSQIKNAHARILYGGGDMNLNEYHLHAVGRISETVLTHESLELTLRPLSDDLKIAVPRAVFSKETSTRIIDSMIGRTKPLLIGRKTIKPPKIKSRDSDWYLKARDGAYVARAYADCIGLEITGDVAVYVNGRLPYYGDSAWRPLCTTSSNSFTTFEVQVRMDTGSIRFLVSEDGSAVYSLIAFQVLRPGSRQEILCTYHSDADADKRGGFIFVDGEATNIYESGTKPASIATSTADFRFCGRQGSSETLDFDIYEAVISEEYSSSGGVPTDQDKIRGQWTFEGGLVDVSGIGNHLSSVGIEGKDFIQESGTNPVYYGIPLNGVNMYYRLGYADQTGLNITGVHVIQVRVRPQSITGNAGYYCRFDQNTANESIQFRRIGGALRLSIYDGSAYFGWTTPTVLQINEEIEATGAYKPSSYVRIWLGNVLVLEATSGIPAQINSSSADLTIGAALQYSNPIEFDSNELISVAVHDQEISSPVPLTSFISRWRFNPENHRKVSGGQGLVDDMGINNLSAFNIQRADYERVGGGDVYQVAGEQNITIHSVWSGNHKLKSGIDHQFDSQTRELTVWRDNSSEIEVDASGARYADLPFSIPGISGSTIIERDVDALLYLLTVEAGFESEHIDMESFHAARIDSKPVAFYLSSQTQLVSVAYKLCRCSGVLDMFVNDRVRLKRYCPDLSVTTEIDGQEISNWEQENGDRPKYGNIIVNYGDDEAAERTVPGGGTDTLEVDSFLAREGDARLLACRLALLASGKVISCSFQINNNRLADAVPGTVVLFNKLRAGGPAGCLEQYPLVVREITSNTAKGVGTVMADNWQGALESVAKLVDDGYPEYDVATLMEKIRGGFVKTSLAGEKYTQVMF